MNIGIDYKNILQIKEVFSLFPQIEEAILYGSRAKGTFKEGSDIDLTIKGDGLNLEIANSLSSKLEDLSLPYTFDISIYSQIQNQELIEHIQRVGKSFYKRL